MAADTETLHERDPDDQVRDMRRLLERAERFATTVRSEIAALDAAREAALAEVQREADAIRAEALEEARSIRAQAEESARATIERGHSTAVDITEGAYEELREIERVLGRYREAVETAGVLFGTLPEAPSPQETTGEPVASVDAGGRPSPGEEELASHRELEVSSGPRDPGDHR